jgi:hypothetical protein
LASTTGGKKVFKNAGKFWCLKHLKNNIPGDQYPSMQGSLQRKKCGIGEVLIGSWESMTGLRSKTVVVNGEQKFELLKLSGRQNTTSTSNIIFIM